MDRALIIHLADKRKKKHRSDKQEAYATMQNRMDGKMENRVVLAVVWLDGLPVFCYPI